MGFHSSCRILFSSFVALKDSICHRFLKGKQRRNGKSEDFPFNSRSFVYIGFGVFFLVLAVTAAAQRLATAIAAATEMSAALLNSGTVGLGEDAVEGDDVGFADVDVLEESEMTSIAVDPAPNISPLPEL